MASTHRLMPETVFADAFIVEKAIGEGAMGMVYRAQQMSDRQICALKILKPRLVKYDPRAAQRFEREATVGARFSSAHVVKVLGAGFDESTELHWLAMEFVDGLQLMDHVETHQPSKAARLQLLEQIFSALAAAHEAGVIHRDLKPDNILVLDQPEPALKVLDFGVAKTFGPSMAASATDGGLGTPLWTAPEQGKSTSVIGPSVDVWALGLLAFYLFTGKIYWFYVNQEGASMLDIAKEMLRDPIALASERAAQLGCEGLPADFDVWFERCVERDATLRFESATEAYDALKAMLAGRADSIAPKHSLRPPPLPPSAPAPPPSAPAPPPSAPAPTAAPRTSKLAAQPATSKGALSPQLLALLLLVFVATAAAVVIFR